MFMHHLVGIFLCSPEIKCHQNIFLEKLSQKERPVGFFPRELGLAPEHSHQAFLYDTWSNAALRELTHCPKA